MLRTLGRRLAELEAEPQKTEEERRESDREQARAEAPPNQAHAQLAVAQPC